MKFFYDGLELDVPQKVYYPREDSVFFSEYISKMNLEGKSVLDVGCGSGILSLVAAKKGAKVMGIDVSKISALTTVKNAKKNGLRVSVLVGNVFDPIKGKFDIIIFNSPYLPYDKFDTSKDVSNPRAIKKFVDEYKFHLVEGGEALLLISSITDFNVRGDVVARKKIPWEELMIVRLV